MTGKRKLIKAAGTNRKGRPKAIKRKAGAFFEPTEHKAAIERIIRAAGKPPDDEALLAADIEEADSEFDLHLEVKDADAAKARKLLKRICKGLENATKLIEPNPLIKRVARPYDLPGLLKALRRIEYWQAMRQREMQLHPKEGRQSNPIEWLAGLSLALVYKRRFGSEIIFDRDDDGKATGPVIDFIEATMAELGLHYSRESIATAISHLRAQ